MVGEVGLEPTMYQSCLIYSQVRSPLRYSPMIKLAGVENYDIPPTVLETVVLPLY